MRLPWQSEPKLPERPVAWHRETVGGKEGCEHLWYQNLIHAHMIFALYSSVRLCLDCGAQIREWSEYE